MWQSQADLAQHSIEFHISTEHEAYHEAQRMASTGKASAPAGGRSGGKGKKKHLTCKMILSNDLQH